MIFPITTQIGLPQRPARPAFVYKRTRLPIGPIAVHPMYNAPGVGYHCLS